MKWLPTSAFLLALLPLSLADASIVTTNPYSGVTLIQRTETSPRPVNINIVEIDLTDPGISFKLSPPTPPAPNTFNSETHGQRTLDYLNQEHAQLAVNVNFFDFPLQANGGTNLTGFAASMGNVYSQFDAAPVLNYAILPDSPVLNIDAANHVTFAQRGADASSLMANGTPLPAWNALSGSARIITDGAKSLPVGLPPRPNINPPSFWYTDQIAARTAIGLSQDGHTLFLFTVDAFGTSQGMTVSEEADFLMSQYGVYNALNLDGGGSTTLAMANPASGIDSVINGASGGPRTVGSNLAIFAATVAPEPGSLAVLAAGLTLLVRARRRPAH